MPTQKHRWTSIFPALFFDVFVSRRFPNDSFGGATFVAPNRRFLAGKLDGRLMGVGRGDRGQLGMGGADRDDKDDDFHGKDEDESEKQWLRGCGGGCVEIIVVGWIWKDVKSAKLGDDDCDDDDDDDDDDAYNLGGFWLLLLYHDP